MNRTRSAAALIMALLILVGLMLLGLPFLFSQSVSRAGSATIAARQAAHIYNSSSLNLGLGLAIYTQENYRGVNLPNGVLDNVTWTDLSTSLPGGILRTDGSPQATGLDPMDPPAFSSLPATNQMTVQTRGLNAAAGDTLSWNSDGQRVRTSLKLEDESGKIDGNSLGPLGWAEVFKAAGIDDKDITTSPASDPDAIDATASTYLSHLNPGGNGWIFSDLSPAGQLADAIALRRIQNGPYHRIEDLLLVDPQSPSLGIYKDPLQTSGGAPLYRTGLTPAELDRLRPLISFSTPGPGRKGFADFGNQSAEDGLSTSIYPDLSESIPSDDLMIGGAHAWGITNSHLVGNQLSITIRTVGNMSLQVGDGLTFQLPAPINLNQATPKTREALGLTIDPGTLPRKSWLTTDDTALLLWRDTFLSSTTVQNRFHPPISFSSLGIVRVSSQAAVTVPTNGGLGERTVAQESRTIIAQALPQQQGTINVQWRNQAELQDLVMTHAGSRVATQPARTVLRTFTAANGNTPATLATTLRPGSYDLDDSSLPWFRRPGLRPSKLTNFGDYTSAPPWLPTNDWLILPDPVSWGLTPDSDQVTADGFFTGTTPVSVKFSTATPLQNWQANGRHLSFWVCATDELNDKTRLLEVGNGTPDRNSLRLTWDPSTSLLVLRLTNPAFPDTVRYRFDKDDPLSTQNENAQGWGPEAVAYPPPGLLPASQETVLAMYLGNQAFKPGRWHHLQLAVGNGTPGSLCLLVDGTVGRDLSRTTTVSQDFPGDYAILPCAVLKTALTTATPDDMEHTAGLLEPKNLTTGNTPSIQLALSGFWARHETASQPPEEKITINKLFPPGGILRIGREYLHYEDMATNGTITRYWRGVRQDSNTDHSDPVKRYPQLQAHAVGSLVLPGGFSLAADGPIAFKHGQATLLDLPGDTVNWQLGKGKITNLAAEPQVNDTLAVTNITGSWPDPCILTINQGYYECTGGSSPKIVNVILASPHAFNPLTSYTVTVVSLRATQQVNDWGTPELRLNQINPIYCMQISNPLMEQVEWLAYDAIATGQQGFYFIKKGDGDFRANMRSRTPFKDWTGESSVIVRPIQSFNPRNASSEWFRPGDHLSYLDETSTWRHLVIRYVTYDQHQVPGATAADTTNGQFTILDGSDPLPASGQHWAAGQGWNPSLGAPYGNITSPALLPKYPSANQNEWSDTTTLTLGGPGANNTSETLSTVPLLVDGFASGALRGGFVGIKSMPTPPLQATDLTPTFAFTTTLGTKPLNIALIDGEAMAYHLDGTGNMVVDGRGLLGSEATDHGGLVPDNDHAWPVMLLPTGPVRQFGSYPGTPPRHASITENWFPIVEDPNQPLLNDPQYWSGYWTDRSNDPPGMLLVDTSTTTPTYHGIHLIGHNNHVPDMTSSSPYQHYAKWACPTWLQGLWGTVTPPPTTGRPPLVIGWFPRFASFMPQTTPSAEQFRSRIYAWASFPVRLPRLRLPSPAITTANLPIRTILNAPTSSPTVQFRIMAGAVNGNDQAPGCLRDGGTRFSDWSVRTAATEDQLLADPDLISTAATANNPGVPRDLDGFEVRVTWHYDGTPATSLTDIADHMNTTPPAIGTPVKLPVQAPVTVLATE